MADYLKTSNDLECFLRKRGENHKSYKTYSKQKYIREIVNEQRIYLNDGSNWNDVADRNAFNDEKSSYKNYGKCFSFSDSESVAMWMLYGGIENQGAMISFSRKNMRQIYDIDSIVLGTFLDGKFQEYSRLKKGQYDIFFTDILYTRDSDSGAYIRRSSESIKNVDRTLIKGLGGFCVKDIAWSYENECRLVVRIEKSFIKKEETVVKIDLSSLDFSDSFSNVYHSPTFKGDRVYEKSELTGYVDWNLCKDCLEKK